MPQKLILPIPNMQITADYKVAAYKSKYGFGHYGSDSIDKNRQSRKVYGMGNGTVVACGMDGATAKDRLGNCIVIVYRDVLCNDNVVRDLACRMFHFDKILCKVGDIVAANSVIGEYGSTGKYGNGAHLHIEFDTDIKYSTYAVGIAASGNIIKAGTVDSTLSAFKVFYLASGQSIYAAPKDITDGWVRPESLNLPVVDNDLAAQLKAVTEEKNLYYKQLQEIKKIVS